MTTITICDICETRDNVNRIQLVYGRSMDGAGSKDDDVKYFDLCEHHELSAYKELLKKRCSKKALHEVNADLIRILISMPVVKRK